MSTGWVYLEITWIKKKRRAKVRRRENKKFISYNNVDDDGCFTSIRIINSCLLKAICMYAENEKEKKKIDCMSLVISFVTNCVENLSNIHINIIYMYIYYNSDNKYWTLMLQTVLNAKKTFVSLFFYNNFLFLISSNFERLFLFSPWSNSRLLVKKLMIFKRSLALKSA